MAAPVDYGYRDRFKKGDTAGKVVHGDLKVQPLNDAGEDNFIEYTTTTEDVNAKKKNLFAQPKINTVQISKDKAADIAKDIRDYGEDDFSAQRKLNEAGIADADLQKKIAEGLRRTHEEKEPVDKTIIYNRPVTRGAQKQALEDLRTRLKNAQLEEAAEEDQTDAEKFYLGERQKPKPSLRRGYFSREVDDVSEDEEAKARREMHDRWLNRNESASALREQLTDIHKSLSDINKEVIERYQIAKGLLNNPEYGKYSPEFRAADVDYQDARELQQEWENRADAVNRQLSETEHAINPYKNVYDRDARVNAILEAAKRDKARKAKKQEEWSPEEVAMAEVDKTLLAELEESLARKDPEFKKKMDLRGSELASREARALDPEKLQKQKVMLEDEVEELRAQIREYEGLTGTDNIKTATGLKTQLSIGEGELEDINKQLERAQNPSYTMEREALLKEKEAHERQRDPYHERAIAQLKRQIEETDDVGARATKIEHLKALEADAEDRREKDEMLAQFYNAEEERELVTEKAPIQERDTGPVDWAISKADPRTNTLSIYDRNNPETIADIRLDTGRAQDIIHRNIAHREDEEATQRMNRVIREWKARQQMYSLENQLQGYITPDTKDRDVLVSKLNDILPQDKNGLTAVDKAGMMALLKAKQEGWPQWRQDEIAGQAKQRAAAELYDVTDAADMEQLALFELMHERGKDNLRAWNILNRVIVNPQAYVTPAAGYSTKVQDFARELAENPEERLLAKLAARRELPAGVKEQIMAQQAEIRDTQMYQNQKNSKIRLAQKAAGAEYRLRDLMNQFYRIGRNTFDQTTGQPNIVEEWDVVKDIKDKWGQVTGQKKERVHISETALRNSQKLMTQMQAARAQMKALKDQMNQEGDIISPLQQEKDDLDFLHKYADNAHITTKDDRRQRRSAKQDPLRAKWEHIFNVQEPDIQFGYDEYGYPTSSKKQGTGLSGAEVPPPLQHYVDYVDSTTSRRADEMIKARQLAEGRFGGTLITGSGGANEEGQQDEFGEIGRERAQNLINTVYIGDNPDEDIGGIIRGLRTAQRLSRISALSGDEEARIKNAEIGAAQEAIEGALANMFAYAEWRDRFPEADLNNVYQTPEGGLRYFEPDEAVPVAEELIKVPEGVNPYKDEVIKLTERARDLLGLSDTHILFDYEDEVDEADDDDDNRDATWAEVATSLIEKLREDYHRTGKPHEDMKDIYVEIVKELAAQENMPPEAVWEYLKKGSTIQDYEISDEAYALLSNMYRLIRGDKGVNNGRQ